MKFKKVIAAILCAAMTAGAAGVTGCKPSNEKNTEQIEELMESYTEALNDLDGEGLLELANWEDDSKDYEAIEELFDLDSYEDIYGSGFIDCVEYIASTIEINYESEDIDFKDNKATLKIEYELVDWETVYSNIYVDLDDALDDLKSMKKTISVEGKLSFELEDGEWKISKITKLNDVLDFVDEAPIMGDPEPIIDDPIETDPTTDPSTDYWTQVYMDSVVVYLEVLAEHETEIKKAEEIYNKDFVNLYDMNADGILDLIFVSADDPSDDYSTASLHIYTYDYVNYTAYEVITIPEICYMAEGGSFIIAVCYGLITITCYHGEEAHRQVDTYVYDLAEMELQLTYRRDVYYEYDPDTDTENYSYEYYYVLDGEYVEIDEDEYMSNVEYFVELGIVVIGYDYLPGEMEVEYPLRDLPDLGFHAYDVIVEDYKDLVG
ncbi:MAG: hypothetical protein K6E12_03250 [Saccharofermentans sp.]|nr:hypothetical protein [Saccharofermentans sp.]